MSEKSVYNYIRYLRDTKAAPTKAGAFRQSVAFVGGVLTDPKCLEAAASRRVTGSALEQQGGLGDEIKKSPLAVSMIISLEKVACATDPARQQDALFAGFFRFCIAGRVRIADAVRIIDEPIIATSPGKAGDFIETKLGGARYKT